MNKKIHGIWKHFIVTREREGKILAKKWKISEK